MWKVWTMAIMGVALTGCSNGVTTMEDRSQSPCADKPNCVSTLDTREKFALTPYTLKADTTIEQVESIALSIGNAKTAVKTDDYLRIEFTSSVFRFVDDLELRLDGEQLIVRSESRTGYSDFGVNRRRADVLRAALLSAELLVP